MARVGAQDLGRNRGDLDPGILQHLVEALDLLSAHHVAAEGHELVAEFIDDGHSGARLDRPGLDGLRDAAEAGLLDAVWCLSPSEGDQVNEEELRKEAVRRGRLGETPETIAADSGRTTRWVRKWVARHDETPMTRRGPLRALGHRTPRRRGPRTSCAS